MPVLGALCRLPAPVALPGSQNDRNDVLYQVDAHSVGEIKVANLLALKYYFNIARISLFLFQAPAGFAMTLTFNSLLANGINRWHTGDQSVTYSFLGPELPSYYDVYRESVPNDRGGDLFSFTNDAYVLGYTGTGGQQYLMPLDFDASFNEFQVAAAVATVQAWNDVAKINLVAGSASGGGGSSGTPVSGGNALVGGLGGDAGYGENTAARNDDGNTFYGSSDLSAVFADGLNFFGTTYDGFYVNTNGSISFGRSISTYTPDTITSGGTPAILPFWADVDTRQYANDAFPPAIHTDFDAVNGIVTVTWPGVDYYSTRSSDHVVKNNYFQLQLYDRGSGDFDIVFRYQDIEWSSGNASDGTDGLGGTPARAGWTAGDGSNFFELPQSGNEGQILSLESTLGNTGQTGMWVFEVRNGSVSAAPGDITFGAFESRRVNGSDENSAPTISSAGQPDMRTLGFTADPGTLGTPSDHGDIWLNNNIDSNTTAVEGQGGWGTLLHELGHALGLSHPNDDPDNNAGSDENNNQYTVMSYQSHPDSEAATNGLEPITPMLYDMQAIQHLYGANMETRTGDTTYFSSAAGSVFSIPSGGRGIYGVWDAGGIDTFDASNQVGGVELNLAPGEFSSIGGLIDNIVIARGTNADGSDISGAMDAWIENAVGGLGSDILAGNIMNNEFTGNQGDDAVFGLAGLDTAIYAAARAGATVQKDSGGTSYTVTVTSTSEGTDTLVDVERIRFSDGTLAVDIDGNAGQTFRLYRAAFDREPDQPGLAHNVALMDAGLSIFDMANAFIMSAEFQQTYGAAIDNTAFLTLLYQNVLDRAPDQVGLNGWLTQLSSGAQNREQVLFGFSESAENKLATAPLTDDGIWLG